MKRILLLVIGVVMLFAPVARAQKTEKVGTFDRQSIVVAFYRSSIWAETLKARAADRDEALRNGDQAKVKALEQWGGDAQKLAERQLEGKAPIDNILAALAPAFRDIEKSAELAKIVPASHGDGTAQSVDVTDRLLDWMKADEKTRQIVKQLRHE